MKNYFKAFVLLLTFILLTNCEKEENLNTIDDTISENNVKQNAPRTLSLSDLKTDRTFTRLSNYYLPNLLESANKTYHLKNITDDFIITSDTINVVEKENYKSYTIRIKRHTESSYTVENLVLEQRDSLQKAFIFSYEFEPEWIVEFLGDKKTPPKGKVSIKEYDIDNLKSSNQKSGFCAWIDIWITFPCGCGHYSRPPCKGSTCGGRFWPQKEIHSVYYCDSTGDGFFDLAGGGSGGSSGGGGGGFPTEPADGTETGMVMEDTTEMMIYGVMVDLANSLELNPVQRDWVLDPANYIVGLKLNDFLSDNEDSQEARNFAVAIIDGVLNDTKVTNSDVLNVVDAFIVNDWINKFKLAIASGITSTAELTHTIYNEIGQIVEDNPNLLPIMNIAVDRLSDIANLATDTNPQTVTWFDLFNMWLFELGSNPVNFDGDDVTTLSLKTQEGVNQARSLAISKIQNNDFSPTSLGWTYGQEAFYDGITNGNIATSFLGSYNTNINVMQNSNGTFTLNFTISNSSTWSSATRLRIDNDGDGVHDGVFPNKERGEGIHIGGNFDQNWSWSEIYP